MYRLSEKSHNFNRQPPWILFLFWVVGMLTRNVSDVEHRQLNTKLLFAEKKGGGNFPPMIHVFGCIGKWQGHIHEILGIFLPFGVRYLRVGDALKFVNTADRYTCRDEDDTQPPVPKRRRGTCVGATIYRLWLWLPINPNAAASSDYHGDKSRSRRRARNGN